MVFEQIKLFQTIFIFSVLSILGFISANLPVDQQAQLDRELKKNPNMMKHFCDEGYPYASVGDFNITSHTHFKK